MKFCLFLWSLFVKFYVTNGQDWTSCITTGIDYTGDNVIKGLRFSNEECALWCKTVSTYSVQGVL